MWIFTRKGFISVVAWRGCDRTLCVRARLSGHLDDLFPGCNVVVIEGADYRYRTRVERKYFEGVVAAEIRLIDYDNFKRELVDHRYHDACLDVWRAMHRLQEPRRRVYGEAQFDLWAPPAIDPEDDIPWSYR